MVPLRVYHRLSKIGARIRSILKEGFKLVYLANWFFEPFVFGITLAKKFFDSFRVLQDELGWYSASCIPLAFDS